jgi:hypothetical protein
MLNGVVSSLRDVVSQNLATVTVVAQTPRLGAATVSADGMLTYTPNPNAYGTDNVNYTVTVDGQVSNQAVAQVTITPVNDFPVAANQSINGVVGFAGTMNLLLGATDPDGNADVKDAVITTWPAGLGAQPTPVNGVISFTPAAATNYTFNYVVKDAAGVLSNNVGTGTVTALASESISLATRVDYTAGKQRWVISGTDTVRAGQEITIVYTNGTSRVGENCATSPQNAPIPACVVAKVKVDGAGLITFDQIVTANSAQDPRGTYWNTNARPTSVKAFSSAPVLGGVSQPQGINVR